MKTKEENFQQAVGIQRNCMKVRLDFAWAIKNEMERRGISQQHLALRLHCSPSVISQVLSARFNLESATMVKIADAVGLKVSFDLIPNEPKKDPTP